MYSSLSFCFHRILSSFIGFSLHHQTRSRLDHDGELPEPYRCIYPIVAVLIVIVVELSRSVTPRNDHLLEHTLVAPHNIADLRRLGGQHLEVKHICNSGRAFLKANRDTKRDNNKEEWEDLREAVLNRMRTGIVEKSVASESSIQGLVTRLYLLSDPVSTYFAAEDILHSWIRPTTRTFSDGNSSHLL